MAYEPEAYLKPCETLTMHIQYPVMHGTFNHIQAYSETCATRAYAET